MVISVNDYKQIRQRYLNGESQCSIAKAMGIFRNTVKKYCEGENVPWERKTPEREASVLTEDVLVFIAQYNYQKLQSKMENIASPKWRKLQRLF